MPKSIDEEKLRLPKGWPHLAKRAVLRSQKLRLHLWCEAEGGMTMIEWAAAVWIIVTGCTPVSIGCAICYATRMARRLTGRALTIETVLFAGGEDWPPMRHADSNPVANACRLPRHLPIA